MDGYPHLSFQSRWELSKESHYLIGECDALVRAISDIPLRPADRDRLLTVSLIKGAQATTAIEGNTLSSEEVERIFEGENLPPSRSYLQIEVTNVIDALNTLLEQVVREGKEWRITPELILNFHRMISKDLGDHIDAVPGRFRTDRRSVGPYLAPEHRNIPTLIDTLCDWVKREFHFHKEQDFQTAVVQAIVTHIYIEWVHPFGDGNGRTGRLIEFFILLRAGVPSICSHILSNFYNETRSEYYRQLNDCRKKNDLTGFIEYALLGFRDGLGESLKIIQAGQLRIYWRNHIFETFADLKYHKKSVFKRRRDLMLGVPLDKALSLDEIVTTSKPEVMKVYLTLGEATLKRDLKELIQLQLLIREGKKYSTNLSILHAALPERKIENSV